MVSHPRGLESSTTPLWQSQMSGGYRGFSLVGLYTSQVGTLGTHDPNSELRKSVTMEHGDMLSPVTIYQSIHTSKYCSPECTPRTPPYSILPHILYTKYLIQNSNPQLPLHIQCHYFIWQLWAATSCCLAYRINAAHWASTWHGSRGSDKC
jgi:hypothetical protein